MRFEDTNLIPELLQAVSDAGYEAPTRIQEDTIPLALMGRDVLGCAQTGTGKTAAFALPILQRLYLGEKALYGGRTAGTSEEPVPAAFARTMDEAYGRVAKTEAGEPAPKAKTARGKKSKASGQGDADDRKIRALILTPTRELALQIGESFDLYGRHLPLRTTVIFGGVSQNPQTDELKRGIDILVATPGRLNDLIGQGFISLSDLEIFVLDEADRMLDMGFIHDVRRIMTKLPAVRQTLLFSATMPMEVEKLALDLLYQPITVKVNPPTSTVDAIHQTVYFVDKANKRKLLLDLLKEPAVESALVFVRTKHGADRVARDLVRGGVSAKSIHGDKSQGARQEALAQFKAGKIHALVATDIAARGIDIFGLSHVFNYDVPNEPETYIHRIGRTGRAGLTGEAVTFCCYDELELFRAVEKLINMNIEDVPSPYPMEVFASSGERIGRPPVGAEKSTGRRSSQDRGGRKDRGNDVKKYGRDRREKERRFPKEEWFDPETEDVVETGNGSSFDDMAEAAVIGAVAVAAAIPGEGAPKKKRRRRRKKKPAELTPSAEGAETAATGAEERPETPTPKSPKQPKNEPAETAAEGKPDGAEGGNGTATARKRSRRKKPSAAAGAEPKETASETPVKAGGASDKPAKGASDRTPKGDKPAKGPSDRTAKGDKPAKAGSAADKPAKSGKPAPKGERRSEAKKERRPFQEHTRLEDRGSVLKHLPKKQEAAYEAEPDDDFMPKIVFKNNALNEASESAGKAKKGLFSGLFRFGEKKEAAGPKPTDELNTDIIETRTWQGSRGQRPKVVDRRSADDDDDLL